MQKPTPSPLKISTITATAKLDVQVDLDVFFDRLEVWDTNGTDGTNSANNYFEYAEFGAKKGEARCKPEAGLLGKSKLTRNKNGVPRRGAKEKKRFDNQVTVVVRYDGGAQKANAKVFRNGHIQITGLKTVEGGKHVVGILQNALQRMAFVDHPITCHDFKIRLINSDFRIGFEVRRDVLKRLMAHSYGVLCSFEPCIYPGCKIEYWYNNGNRDRDGRCKCMKKCMGKGIGDGDGSCKKVTIAVFHSGSVIITGGQSKEQIDEAYAFICRSLMDNYDDVRKIKSTVPIFLV